MSIMKKKTNGFFLQKVTVGVSNNIRNRIGALINMKKHIGANVHKVNM